MMKLAIISTLIALMAALFGFNGVAASATGLAQLLFWFFLAISILSLARIRNRHQFKNGPQAHLERASRQTES